MADGRMLHKKISLNEAVASLENDVHRLLFTWGLAHLDIEGRISGSPKVFRAIVVPLLEHITTEKVVKFFKDAESQGLIIRYQVDKDWFIQYPKFTVNQRLRADREAPSKLPPPPEELLQAPGELPEYASETQEDSGLKFKLSLREDKGKDMPISSATPTPKNSSSKNSKKAKTPLPDNFQVSEAVQAWAIENHFDKLDKHLDAFKRKATMNGYVYVNWDMAFMEAIREDWAKIRVKGYASQEEPQWTRELSKQPSTN